MITPASSILGLVGSIIPSIDGIEIEKIIDVVQKTLQSSTITAKYIPHPDFATTKIGALLSGNTLMEMALDFNNRRLLRQSPQDVQYFEIHSSRIEKLQSAGYDDPLSQYVADRQYPDRQVNNSHIVDIFGI